MDVREYARVLRRRWLAIVASMMICVAGALAYTMTTAKTYTATATSFVNVTVPTNQDPSAIYQQSQFLVQRMNTYTQFVDSPAVLDPAITSLHLPLTAKQLAKQITATSPTATVALQVAVTDHDAARAAQIANSVSTNLGAYIQKFETPASGQSSSVKVTLSKPATVPAMPSAPRPTFNLVLGLLAGFAIGIGVAIGRDRLSSSVESAEEITHLTRTNVLGRVLHNPRTHSQLVALEKHSGQSEAYRTIRVNLRFANVDQQPRSLVVTSAAAQEGKTTVICNLAIAMAEGGARVCLVDADLRRPMVGELLGMDNSVGLTDVLAGEHDVRDVLVPWQDGLVTVLTSGSVPPDPNALLSSRSMAALIATLTDEFDVVLFDTPPLLPVTDALILGKLTDGVVLVTRRGRTKRTHVSAAFEAIALSHAKLLGTIFNDVKLGIGPRKRFEYGAAYIPRPDAVRYQEPARVKPAAQLPATTDETERRNDSDHPAASTEDDHEATSAERFTTARTRHRTRGQRREAREAAQRGAAPPAPHSESRPAPLPTRQEPSRQAEPTPTEVDPEAEGSDAWTSRAGSAGWR